MYDFINVLDDYKQMILDAERHIWKNPETGYREYKTTEFLISQFKQLGYKEEDIVRAEGTTGFYTAVDTKKEGPTVLVLAELDSLINANHPECDSQTKYVHTCGHNVQCAAILGVAAALKRQEVISKLCGKIKLCLVPAEEGIEIEYRKSLIDKGVIKYNSGKAEFISRRYFEDVDIAFMVHTTNMTGSRKFSLTKGHNGVIRKSIVVKGKSAHAGAYPHNGINALNAANLMLLAINSLRETFTEDTYARIHSIITKGGEAVNAVPDEVKIESYVRAANPIAHKKINDAVNRTISACAAAIGANVTITDLPGSEALNEDANLRKVALEVFENLAGKDGYSYNDKWFPSSTDMGDISTLFPAIHCYVGGTIGTAHGIDFYVDNPYLACVENAKMQVALLYELLTNNAEKAKEVIANYKPVFNSVDEYVKHKDSITMSKECVNYNEDGTITLNFKK